MKRSLTSRDYYSVWVGGGWWIPIVGIISLSQPSLAGVGAGAELGSRLTNFEADRGSHVFITPAY